MEWTPAFCFHLMNKYLGKTPTMKNFLDFEYSMWWASKQVCVAECSAEDQREVFKSVYEDVDILHNLNDEKMEYLRFE